MCSSHMWERNKKCDRFRSAGLVLFFLLLSTYFVCCSGTSDKPYIEEISIFPDPYLELAVQRALGVDYPEDIELEELNNLRKLDARGMGITNISGLENLQNLKYLYLSENEIDEICPISSLTNLRYLYLSGNKIEDISSIKHLKGLRVLFLGNNQIKDIRPIFELENIGVIYLRNNLISDISPLVENNSLTEVWVWLEGNPLSEISISRDVPILRKRDVEVSYSP